MYKVKFRENENKFVFITPPPIKATGFPEWATTWRIGKSDLKTNLVEISNPYYDYFKLLPLDTVQNFDEDFKIFRNAFSIVGILKLNVQLILNGYQVIIKKNKAKWKEWHYKNYLAKEKGLPVLYPDTFMQYTLRKILMEY